MFCSIYIKICTCTYLYMLTNTSAPEVAPLLWKVQLFSLPTRFNCKGIIPSFKTTDHGNNNQI